VAGKLRDDLRFLHLSTGVPGLGPGGEQEQIMYDALASMFSVRALMVSEVEPVDPETDIEEYGGNSINDPNPSGNPDEDDN